MRFGLGLLTTCALAASACGGAHKEGPPTPRLETIRGDTVDLWFVSGDRSLPVYDLDGRRYLLGEKGKPYEIWLANLTNQRLEAVVSVDGRDVITGRPADYRRDRGYILNPGERVPIEGWRRSLDLDTVAAFEFGGPDESYAARMGGAENVGVIGVAVFAEAEPVPIGVEEQRMAPAPAMPLASGGAATDDRAKAEEPGLGTKYGKDRGSTAEVVPFRRVDQERPTEVLDVYYDDRGGLEKTGVIFDDDSDDNGPCSNGPNPFPGVPCAEGFAPPPPPA
ncbi:MAG: hypothetical protein PHU25_14795 [Deltaproteobacteria bacterium]|nr:hypothetical protein [Deltaproteobacteria bacterium]